MSMTEVFNSETALYLEAEFSEDFFIIRDGVEIEMFRAIFDEAEFSVDTGSELEVSSLFPSIKVTNETLLKFLPNDIIRRQKDSQEYTLKFVPRVDKQGFNQVELLVRKDV